MAKLSLLHKRENSLLHQTVLPVVPQGAALAQLARPLIGRRRREESLTFRLQFESRHLDSYNI